MQSDFSFDLPHTVSSVNNSTAETSGAAAVVSAESASPPRSALLSACLRCRHTSLVSIGKHAH